MANEEQLSILRKGVDVWNRWREENPDVKINLNDADLREADLGKAKLYGANLRGANLIDAYLLAADLGAANLGGARLSRASLREANLMLADLNGANLRDADLSQADLTKANLIAANLSGAHLFEAYLNGAYLNGADLTGARLSRAHLLGTDLNATNLNGAILTAANLTGAQLFEADLLEALLNGARLSSANLSRANLSRADLNGANLSGALLLGANFHRADLRKAQLSKAEIADTVFGNSDLSSAMGLNDVVHGGPSIISIDTFALSMGNIPEAFLKGCGLSDTDIEYSKLFNPDLSNEKIIKILYKIYDLRATQALQISPIFISYSRADSKFVDKLSDHLSKRGIRYWRDTRAMTAGRIEKQIDHAISQNPTVLLILSEHALRSDWVEHEVRLARTLAKDINRDVLCPVALDDSWTHSPWPARVMEQIMEYNILDFSEWGDDVKFEGMFRKLIDGLELFYKG